MYWVRVYGRRQELASEYGVTLRVNISKANLETASGTLWSCKGASIVLIVRLAHEGF